MSDSRVSLVGAMSRGMPETTTSSSTKMHPARKFSSEGKEVVGDRLKSREVVKFDDLEGLASEINDIMKGMRNEIRFEILRDSSEFVVQVVDGKTDEIIRTIPPENLLNVRAKFEEVLGLIFDEER